MRLIDANKLMLWLNDVWYSSFKYEESPTSISVKKAMKAITEYVNTHPTIDAVEVVRCKECRYFKKIAERSNSGLCRRDIVASAWKENGYCSRGERKGGEDEWQRTT